MLEVAWADGARFRLPAEYLRVESPSAEVQGHGPGQKVIDRRADAMSASCGVEPVGNYAVRIVFDDLHDTGIYSWDYLRTLGAEQETRWATYLANSARAGCRGTRRDADPARRGQPGPSASPCRRRVVPGYRAATGFRHQLRCVFRPPITSLAMIQSQPLRTRLATAFTGAPAPAGRQGSVSKGPGPLVGWPGGARPLRS